MFVRKPSLFKSPSMVASSTMMEDASSAGAGTDTVLEKPIPTSSATTTQDLESATMPTSSSSPASRKRSIADASTNKPLKIAKSGSVAKTSPAASNGQQSLKGFFKSTSVHTLGAVGNVTESQVTLFRPANNASSTALFPAADLVERSPTTSLGLQVRVATSSADTTPRIAPKSSQMDGSTSAGTSPSPNGVRMCGDEELVHDPIESKESWMKLFTKPAAPRCEGHNEPCITLLTKKSGMNCGRSFWMCPRPIGPSGAKEKNTQWRCQTFIWCSDWNPNSA